MSGQAETSTNALVRSGCSALAPATGANSLVSRAIADLIRKQPAPGAGGLDRVIDEAKLVVQGILQRLVDAAGDRGYLTCQQVSEHVGFEIYRIEPDADLKTLPESPLNRKSLKQLLAALEEHDIEVITEEDVVAFEPDYEAEMWVQMRDALEQTLRENPRNADACEQLALLLTDCDAARAVRLARFACKLTDWKDAAKLATLAAAYAEDGKYHKAEHYQRQAQEDPAYAGPAARERLALYEEMKSRDEEMNALLDDGEMQPEPLR